MVPFNVGLNGTIGYWNIAKFTQSLPMRDLRSYKFLSLAWALDECTRFSDTYKYMRSISVRNRFWGASSSAMCTDCEFPSSIASHIVQVSARERIIRVDVRFNSFHIRPTRVFRCVVWSIILPNTHAHGMGIWWARGSLTEQYTSSFALTGTHALRAICYSPKSVFGRKMMTARMNHVPLEANDDQLLLPFPPPA